MSDEKRGMKMERLNAKAKVADDARLLLLKEITELIVKAKRLNLTDTVFLLKIAELDLQTSIHNITDGELHAFLNAVHGPDEDH